MRHSEEAREARKAVMEALQADDVRMYVGGTGDMGGEGGTPGNVIRYGLSEVHALALATYLRADEGKDVLRLMRQLNDENRPEGIALWTDADEKIHLREQMDKVSQLDGLPPAIRDAMEGLMRAIENEAEREDVDDED